MTSGGCESPASLQVWGDEGYIYLEMSSNNTCGIANMATHALVNAPGPPGFKNHTNLDVPLN
jgi:hypothetical protein